MIFIRRTVVDNPGDISSVSLLTQQHIRTRCEVISLRIIVREVVHSHRHAPRLAVHRLTTILWSLLQANVRNK